MLVLTDVGCCSIRQPTEQESEEERQAALEAAAARRQQRLTQDTWDDMPSLSELGISGPGPSFLLSCTLPQP